MKKRAKATPSFIKNSKNAIFALLLIAAAIAVYGIVNAATVSHTPSTIQPQGAGSTLDSDKLQALTYPEIKADILAATSGGYKECYAIVGTDTYNEDGNFLSSGNQDCAGGYTTIISSKGTGCQATPWKAVNIGGSEWMKVETEFISYPSYVHSENLYVVSGGTKTKLASVNCASGGYQSATTLAVCCK